VASILRNTNLCKQERDASYNGSWSKTKHGTRGKDMLPLVPVWKINKAQKWSFQNERKGFPADIPKAEKTVGLWLFKFSKSLILQMFLAIVSTHRWFRTMSFLSFVPARVNYKHCLQACSVFVSVSFPPTSSSFS
jgi:hypothetical protein